ncbi:hypothetical protein C8R44DRAFT_890652 [Mycena epipterygia]|nr:hypothetical protein C8R44DRAFT_890652 [Mycena epipterygia]
MHSHPASIALPLYPPRRSPSPGRARCGIHHTARRSILRTHSQCSSALTPGPSLRKCIYESLVGHVLSFPGPAAILRFSQPDPDTVPLLLTRAPALLYQGRSLCALRAHAAGVYATGRLRALAPRARGNPPPADPGISTAAARMFPVRVGRCGYSRAAHRPLRSHSPGAVCPHAPTVPALKPLGPYDEHLPLHGLAASLSAYTS